MGQMDTTKSQQAAALAAVNLPEVEHPAPPAAPAVKSETTAWTISRDPSPQKIRVQRSEQAQPPQPPSASKQHNETASAVHSRPLLHPDPNAHHLRGPAPKSLKKRPAPQPAKPVAKRQRTKKQRKTIPPDNGPQRISQPQTNQNTCLLSPGYHFGTTIHSQTNTRECMFPILLEGPGTQRKWAACLLCLPAPYPKTHVYFQKLPIKDEKLLVHIESQHKQFHAEQYVAMDSERRLAFLRNNLSSFDHFKNNHYIKRLQPYPRWNCDEFNRVFLSKSSFEQLRVYAMQNVPRIQLESPVQRNNAQSLVSNMEMDNRPFARTRRLLWGAPSQEQQKGPRRQLPSVLDRQKQDLKTLSTPIFYSHDPEHRCGRQTIVCNMQLQSNVGPLIQRPTKGKLSYADAYIHLYSLFLDTKTCSHPEIPRLVLGNLLKDPLYDKSATEDNAFLIPPSFPPLSAGKSAATTSQNGRHLAYISVLTLFYLTRGVSCSVIAELLDAMTEKENEEKGKDASILPLIVRGGNSICAESLRLMRDALDEEHKFNWALAFLTRPCPELGDDGVQVLVAARSWRMLQCDLHVVAVRHSDEIDSRVLPFFDVICGDWKTRFVGINSGIDRSDIKRKTVEQKLFKVLKSVEGVGEVRIIDKELDRYVRPIFSDVVAKMTEEEFIRIVDLHEKRFGEHLSKEQLMNARDALLQSARFKDRCGARASCETNSAGVRQKHDLEDFLEDWVSPDELRDFAYSLKPLYKRYEVSAEQSGCVRPGLVYGRTEEKKAIVDAELERVLHARSLVRVWCLTKITKHGVAWQNSGSTHLGVWDENWSNALRYVEAYKAQPARL